MLNDLWLLLGYHEGVDLHVFGCGRWACAVPSSELGKREGCDHFENLLYFDCCKLFCVERFAIVPLLHCVLEFLTDGNTHNFH